MDAELAQLATSGAATLTGLMVSDAWAQAKDRLGRFFARGDGDGRAESEQLEATRVELEAARAARDTALEDELRDAWRLRLRQVLRTDPAAADQLKALLREVDPDGRAAGGPPRVSVHNTITGGTQYGSVVQAGTISGGVVMSGGAATSAPAAAPKPGPRSWD